MYKNNIAIGSLLDVKLKEQEQRSGEVKVLVEEVLHWKGGLDAQLARWRHRAPHRAYGKYIYIYIYISPASADKTPEFSDLLFSPYLDLWACGNCSQTHFTISIVTS